MKAEFDRYARDYDALLKDPLRDAFARRPEFFHRRKWMVLRDFVRSRGLIPEKLAWLDAGCGKGELLGFGSSSFAAAMGCDPSGKMLDECGHPEVRLQPDPTSLPFEDGSFDVVTAACVYHHLNPAERRLLTSDIRRVLRPGGVFAVFEHNPLNPATRLIVSRTPVDAGAKLVMPRQMRGLASQAGLTPIATRFYLYLPERIFARCGWIEALLGSLPLGGQYAVFATREGAG
jgi:SAM-dependent methyltransferase